MRRAAYAMIRLAHLKSNLAIVRKLAHQSKIMAVVKAEAYGHGMLQVCQALEDIDAFSVSCVNEAMELRESGIQKPLLALQGFSNCEDLENAIAQNIASVIHHQEQLDILKKFKSPALNVYVKIDTGMHRLGFEAARVSGVVEQLKASIAPASTIRIMTHLACADELNNPMTRAQISAFDAIASRYDYEQSIANSAAVLAWPQCHRDWVRPGLLLYGINPIAAQRNTDEIGLRPVMSLHAPLVAIKNCKKGDSIGYGGDFCCPDDRVVGILAIGYADGYPRHLGSAPDVAIGARRAPVLGRVSMDMIAVDLTGIQVQIGAIAELWGESISVNDVAEHAETISYDLLCIAGNTVSRQYFR